MTASTMSWHVRPVVRERGPYSTLRTLAAVPAMFGSVAVMLVAFGFLGRWEPVAIVAWLSAGVAVFTRAGERLLVRVALGLRRPSPRQSQALAHVWSSALAVAGFDPSTLDLYLQRDPAVNAYAAGGRTVAVSAGAEEAFLAQRLSYEQMRAMLVHELGHHGTGSTRSGLMVLWLAAPWRTACRIVLAVSAGLASRRRIGVAVGIVLVGFVLGGVQAVQSGRWADSAVLLGVAFFAVVCPLVDAAVSRASEFAADAFAAERGVGDPLAQALIELAGAEARGVLPRLLATHPSVRSRLRRLADRKSGPLARP